MAPGKPLVLGHYSQVQLSVSCCVKYVGRRREGRRRRLGKAGRKRDLAENQELEELKGWGRTVIIGEK